MEFQILEKDLRSNPVDVEFQNISYRIGKKEILKSISGKFSSGHVTAILGSSGAGKSSLLSVLAGHIQSGTKGDVLINGRPREMKVFRKMSCYLMQDDLLRSFITVREMINITAKLKLGHVFTSKEKEATVEELINAMDLKKCSETEIQYISGGQRKRLSVALEMINNPPVLFIDEPTTGLDEVIANKFVQFLKQLVIGGKTIICTVHQPSDSMFQLFDHVYFMAEGCCVYNGDVDSIVPFLAKVGLPCPSTYSPSDYIIELVHFNETHMLLLKNASDNGRTCNVTNSGAAEFTKNLDCIQAVRSDDTIQAVDFPTSFLEQFWVLSALLLTQMWRNRTLLIIQYAVHIFIALNIGLIYRNIGNDGEKVVTNFLFFITNVTYHSFVHMMPAFLLFPFEIKMMQKEYLNRWYSLKAYFGALSFVALIPTILPASLFSLIVYVLTNQPMQLDRFFEFLLVSILTSMVCQGYGQNIGSFCTPKTGAVLGSTLGLVLLTLAIYNMGFTHLVRPYVRFLMGLSYARRSFAGYSLAVLKDRDLMDCDITFCYLRDPQIGLRIFGLEHEEFYEQAVYLIAFLIVSKLLTFFVLRLRVTPNSKLFVRL